MKKAMSVILALVMCLSLCACAGDNAELEARIAALEAELENLKTEIADADNQQWPEKYVGQWKMKGYGDEVYVLQLNADGTGTVDASFKSDVAWEYNEKCNTIEFKLSYLNSTGSFAIREKEGKTVLDDTITFFGGDFCRAVDFVG